MQQTQDIIVLLTTAPNQDVAEALGKELVAQQLAACVNLIPGMTSIYHWQGKISQDQEVQLIIKSHRRHKEAIEQLLNSSHPYDTPELLTINVESGSNAYIQWIQDSVKK